MTDWSLALKIEHKIQKIITQQEINGFLFDKDRGLTYISNLEDETNELYDKIRKILVPEVIRRGKTVNSPFKSDGGVALRAIKYLGDNLKYLSGPFSGVDFQEPQISKRQKIIKQLKRLRWSPISYTEKGSPKLDEESLMKLDKPEGKLIARWYILKHRQAQIRGWIGGTNRNPGLRDDCRITAYANPCGTNTGRMRHRQLVNVPKANKEVIFGKEMRSLFIVPEGYVLIGHDASGLELRILAHYINDKKFTEEVTHGDPHSYNQEAAGLPTRDDAKTFIYAFIYGAGDKRLGSIVGGDSNDGKELRRKFLSRNKRLAALISGVRQASSIGYLIGLDGRRLYIRSKHSALNTLIQGGGAIVMKVSSILLDKWTVREGPYNLNDIKKVGDFHDEGQAEVRNDKKIIELYSNCAVKSIITAGTFFNLKCPLNAEVSVGNNWAETH